MSTPQEANTIETSRNPHLDDDCAICIDPLQDGTVLRELPCEHVFHVACEEGIVGERITSGTGANRIYIFYKRCPLCRNAYGVNVVPAPLPVLGTITIGPAQAAPAAAAAQIAPTPAVIPAGPPAATAPTAVIPVGPAAATAPTAVIPVGPAPAAATAPTAVIPVGPAAAAPALTAPQTTFPLPSQIAIMQLVSQSLTDPANPLRVPEEAVDAFLRTYYRSLINRALSNN